MTMTGKQDIRDQDGFTLLEILVAIGISSVIMGAIYLSYDNQQKSFQASDQIAEMQQNIRSAMLIMGNELREAGCDPTGFAHAGFVAASSQSVAFTRDIAGNAISPNESDGDTDDPNEDITFAFSSANGTITRKDNNSGNPAQAIADGITDLEFNYVLDTGATTLTPTSSQLSHIRAVQISILAKARIPNKILDKITYTTASGAKWAVNDYYRRRFASTTIKCRDMGL